MSDQYFSNNNKNNIIAGAVFTPLKNGAWAVEVAKRCRLYLHNPFLGSFWTPA
jgi:hypothetical protein